MRKSMTSLSLLLLAGLCWGAPRQLTVDTDKTGAPISKYVYGQFIEHLGRCIYGGLWAEMLEDRKFYFRVSDTYAPWGTASDPNWGSGPFEYLKASPWKVIGPEGCVSMSVVKPYTGTHSPSVRVPDDGSAAGISQERLALVKGRGYTGRIVLAGDPGVSVAVRLIGDDGKAAEQRIGKPGTAFTVHPLRFTAAADSANARLEITGTGTGSFRIGAVSLMPDDNVNGFRRDTVALLRELDAPIYRWPGGNFVSGYDWRDGIGERDARPPRQNPAWKGVEANDVGIHEYMDLMGLIGAEPYVSLNTGLGTVAEAAAEVEYCVGAADTPMGRLRAANGHPGPFPVTWWAVGNEMFGDWQLGHMPIGEYVKKHNGIVEALRKISPAGRFVAVGSVGFWDESILEGSADHMDLISEHTYCREMYTVTAHSRQLANSIESIAANHRNYRKSIPELKGKDIRIAMDEWNYWYGQYVYGELGVQYHLKDALGVARGLHAFYRNSDIYFMANYAQTVNVIGAIKTSRTEAAFDTTGLVLKLYRARFGAIPVAVAGDTGLLDVAAALTEDGKALTVSVVNPTKNADAVLLDTPRLARGTQWTLTGPDPRSVNEPGKPPQVTVTEGDCAMGTDGLQVPGYAAVIFRFELE